jgi:hypothetical protein
MIARITRAWDALARAPVLTATASAFGGCVLLALLWGIPLPRVHDEFTYLLGADTFAHGRLANPVPPLWEHFETFHVLMGPTYASPYPPGHSLVLAFAQVVFGHPIAGVWLEVIAACGAIAWMLKAWLPPRWALAGALFAALRLVLLGGLYEENPAYWSQSYWGGGLAAFAGALVFGAAPRLFDGPSLRHAIALGAGLAILANSRPFEGLLVGIPVAAALFAWLLRRRGADLRAALRRVVIPTAAILLLCGAAIVYYNHRVTGDPLLFPHAAHEQRYAVDTPFWWLPRRPEPTYRHEVMRRFQNESQREIYDRHQSLPGLAREAAAKMALLGRFYLGPSLLAAFLVAVACLPWLLRERRLWLPMAGLFFAGLAAFLTSWSLPHYVAPAAGLVYLLVVVGLRRLDHWRPRGAPLGRLLLWVVTLSSLAELATFLATQRGWEGWHVERARLVADLQKAGGKHLILVQYGPQHRVHEEWVHNGAQIDGSPVIWARAMGAERDRRLVAHFRDRRAWLLEPDGDRRLRAYAPP